MKNVVLWINKEPNQIALVNKIDEKFSVKGIVLESRQSKKRITGKKIYEKFYEKLFLSEIDNSWFKMQDQYSKEFPKLPSCNFIEVDNINSQTAYESTIEQNPDLIAVSGTGLIKKELLSIKPELGIINLHTGLSPYVKGGPNCTNWCLANGDFHLIGNTIMWIDEGIDSGNIITTEFVNFTGTESLYDIHLKVMEHAHQLYVKAIGKIIDDSIHCPNIPQNQISEGKTYYTRQWNLTQKKQLYKNLKQFQKSIASGEVKKRRKKITTISI